jgi:hypothetical protein
MRLIDSEFQKTFITTYQSFTTPYVCLQKLIQRYNTPPKFPKDRATKVKLKITVVLKYWIENQFEDFDSRTVSALSDFINNTLINDGYENVAKMLAKEISKKVMLCLNEGVNSVMLFNSWMNKRRRSR